MPEAIVVVWSHMMSDILVGTALSIGLTPYQCQVITSTNPDLWMEPSLTRWQESELDDIVQTVFQMLFVTENLWTLSNNWLKYIPHGVIGQKSVLDELMARRLTGDQP